MNRLTQLIQANSKFPRSYKVEAKAGPGEDATIYLYDVIGYDFWSGGGVTAKQFAKDLDALGAQTVHLRINSPGGDVFEARAMVAAMQRSKAKIVVHIDGLAASAASFLAMHGSEVEIIEGGFLMIHNGWTLAIGDRHTLTETAALLEKVDGAIVDDYAKKTGLEKAQIAAWMDAETWFTAAECVSFGFANSIAESAQAKVGASWDVTVYDHAPTALTDPPAPEPEPEPEPEPDPKPAQLHASRERVLRLLDRTAA